MRPSDIYWTKAWAEGYFDVNEKGHVVVKPSRKGAGGDLYELVQSLVERGIEAPILLRFDDIIRDRVHYLQKAFTSAIKEFHYRSSYCIAFPIKVNPQRHVVEIVREAGKKQAIGLEVGSKPELTAIMALEDSTEALLLCNGYKDAEYIELALMATKLGRRTIIIIEQVYELKLVQESAAKLGIDAEVGFRMKLSNKGSGRWQSSGGDTAKFGLSTQEIVECLDQLKAMGKSHWLKLLHFHIGSQITSIESIKKALHEGARVFVELAKICPSLAFFDAGGGLAVDYDGTKTTSDSSMNYTVEEYARDVVSAIGEECLKEGLDDPIIITESGRALVAHHSVLITEVIDVTQVPIVVDKLPPPPSAHDILLTLASLYENLTALNAQETLHDVIELKEKILDEFVLGTMGLLERAWAETIYRKLIYKIWKISRELPYVPEDIENLSKSLYETYFCNFSVFQSLPDSWAISQLFPIMPIHRLLQEPQHEAILADLSCDSDGKIDSFVSRKGPIANIKLHDFTVPYYLGIFLVGAYQEIMGGLHNLFGDTNVVHAELDSSGRWNVTQVVEGDTIEEVLRYAQYDPEKLMERLRHLIEKALKAGRLSHAESARIQKKFKQSLESYTYLVV